MYNMTLLFESEVFIIPDTSYNELAEFCPGLSKIGINKTVEHTMTLTDVDKIPTKDWIQNACNVIEDELSQSLKKINGKVIKTEFKGYKEIEEI